MGSERVVVFLSVYSEYRTSIATSPALLFLPSDHDQLIGSWWFEANKGVDSRAEGFLLADEEHINSAQIEIIVERERSESVISRMLTGVQLD